MADESDDSVGETWDWYLWPPTLPEDVAEHRAMIAELGPDSLAIFDAIQAEAEAVGGVAHLGLWEPDGHVRGTAVISILEPEHRKPDVSARRHARAVRRAPVDPGDPVLAYSVDTGRSENGPVVITHLVRPMEAGGEVHRWTLTTYLTSGRTAVHAVYEMGAPADEAELSRFEEAFVDMSRTIEDEYRDD